MEEEAIDGEPGDGEPGGGGGSIWSSSHVEVVPKFP
jgi:hypothetical protein